MDTGLSDTGPPVAQEIDRRIGALFGNYRVVRKLGEGGMGVVYEAEHQKIGRRAAIKLLHGHLAEDSEFALRFLNEARAVNIIRQRGLVEIFEFGKLSDGTLYFVMEFLEGESLRQRIERCKAPFPESTTLGLATQIAQALVAAHEKGIVHRDLKPDNVMLVPDPVAAGLDWVKILDFGIAKVNDRGQATDPDQTDVRTRAGACMGTPLYMAPEQHGHAEGVDGKADVFSLGVMLYQMLTGKLPFEGNALMLLGQAPTPIAKLNPAVSAQLASLVAQMLSPRPEQRPTMQDVARQLGALLPRLRRRRVRRWALLTGIATLFLAAGVGWLFLRPRAPSAQELNGHALAIVLSSLQDEDTALRLHGVRALSQSRDLDQGTRLAALLRDPRQPAEVVEEAARALGQVGAIGAEPALLSLLSQEPSPAPPSIQVAAAGALLQLHHPRGLAMLKQFLGEGGELSRVQAALVLLEQRDLSGAKLLWAELERGRLTESARVEVLGRLALSGDVRARQFLTADLATQDARLSSEARSYVAYNLARLGDESGLALLRKIGSDPQRLLSDQLLAQRLLASLGELAKPGELLKLTAERSRPDAIRELTMAAIADGTREDKKPALAVLASVLKERGASLRLRIAAAGAILKINAGDRSRLAEQSLSWARAALGSDSLGTRALAVAVLADSSSEKAIAPLGQVLAHDRDREIRKDAARALGRKRARAALQALLGSLDDADPDVRAISMQSIGKVLSALEQHGDRAAKVPAITELQRRAKGDSAADRVVASAILIQLGEGISGHRAMLRSSLGSGDALVRRLAVEMSEPDGDLFASALPDVDRGVRFAAARRLVALGSRLPAALAVLREVAAEGDSDGLLAYGILRKLDEPVPPPPGLGSLLSSAELTTRFAVIDLLPQLLLSSTEVLRLLQIAALDPAAVIRRRAAEVAADAYRSSRETRFLSIVRSLLHDPEIGVREQVAMLDTELSSLPAAPQLPAPIEEPAVAPHPPELATPAAPVDAGAEPAAEASGEILLQGDELVRFQIDQGAYQPLTSKPVSVAAGSHRISYVGGSQMVTVPAGQSIKVRIPITLADQLLHDSQDSFKRKEYARAQEQLDRVNRLLKRGKVSDARRADLFCQQAELHEATGQLAQALIEYNRCLSVPVGQRRPALNAALARSLDRLSNRVGHIQIFTKAKDRCQLTQELLTLPGEQTISFGQGRTRTIFAQAGIAQQVKECP